MGGELWFERVDSLWVSGGSGRYGPASEVELADSCRVFESFGYSVSSLGWNSEHGAAVRFLGEL